MDKPADYRLIVKMLEKKLRKELRCHPIKTMEVWLDREHPDILKEDEARTFFQEVVKSLYAMDEKERYRCRMRIILEGRKSDAIENSKEQLLRLL